MNPTQEDPWKFFQDIDFSDESINQYHVDTRDFHVSAFNKPLEQDYNHLDNNNYHTPKEVMELLNRYYSESGGKRDWRFFSLKSVPDRFNGWAMKYIRIFRVEKGLVVCNSQKYAMNKKILNNPVDTEHL